MGELVGDRESFEVRLANVFDEVKCHLDERARRLLLGAMAREIGHGGISLVAEVTATATDTVGRGAGELAAGIEPDGRIRRTGAGRKPVTETGPGILAALDDLVDAGSRGDPMRALRWTTKPTAKLAGELTRGGHPCSARTVAPLPRRLGFSLHGNSKTIEGRQHPDRDAQFRYINDLVSSFQAGGQPVISVDTKKKELTGNYASAGTGWSREPERVNDHDFAGKQLGKVAPYGVYDLTANAGWVNVGTSADTAAFAVESIRRWWEHVARHHYPQAARLLITADSGGPDGSRLRLWKTELATLAAQAGLEITVAHFPPGTSKWNKVEHRLFSFITMNWRARPLTSHQVVIETIAATTTKTGLTVRAMLDTSTYEKGIKISDKEMRAWEARHLQRHDFHGDWNYTVTAESATDPA
jgi:Rhodopirellula transposase DDE domain